ncbi:tetratricopeptide repeat protein [Bradyrhizobium betae]|uniref:Uncharacterized protein n=1 Tax=Bradyrhizobium betae TaxID=244734 RepID=A0A4Q1UXL6_9BRAD|nr:tetratricopeptide repeat protein [Bradyrhizobium betae]RXT41887.1 hypothetical protein B5V03_25585 [Bradyrhizobium betae]
MQMSSSVKWLFSGLAVAALAGLLMVPAADDSDICAKRSGDRAIAACTRDINSGRWHGRDLAISYNNRGAAYYQEGDPDRAIADYSEAIRLDPQYAPAYNNRGITYRQKGDLDRDIADQNEAIRLNPKFASAYTNRGAAYNAKGASDRAIEDYTEAIRLDPATIAGGAALPYAHRGNAYFDQGDLDRALADYSEAIRLDPKSAPAHFNRAATWEAKHDLQKALVDYDTASKLDPQDPHAPEAIGRVKKALSTK